MLQQPVHGVGKRRIAADMDLRVLPAYGLACQLQGVVCFDMQAQVFALGLVCQCEQAGGCDFQAHRQTAPLRMHDFVFLLQQPLLGMRVLLQYVVDSQ